jgi:hypothetical protein
MVITVLEAEVHPERVDLLRNTYRNGADRLPPMIVETFLARDTPRATRWQIITVWRSVEELEEYRRSVDTPGGILTFPAAGAEPTLTRFAVVERLGAP